MENKAKILLEQYERDGDYPKLKRELLLLYNVMPSLPSHIEAGIEAKRYADIMNSKGEFNGFHELDFYNGTVWLRQMIEGNEA
jgi:hypothetical protein